jgi:hypothetical protein
MGVQCKRPLTEKKLERNIRAAINQIQAASAYHGIVAVSVSRIINPGDTEQMPVVEDTEAGHECLKTRVRAIAVRVGVSGKRSRHLPLSGFTCMPSRRCGYGGHHTLHHFGTTR